jgi:hypothetical protein
VLGVRASGGAWLRYVHNIRCWSIFRGRARRAVNSGSGGWFILLAYTRNNNEYDDGGERGGRRIIGMKNGREKWRCL